VFSVVLHSGAGIIHSVLDSFPPPRSIGAAMLLRFVFILFAATAPAAELPHDVYVWQRAWNQPVLDALKEQSTNFQQVVALAAEVTWKDKQPRVTRVPLDYAALRECGRPCGLALRIGPSAGPFRSNDATALTLAALARALVEGARSNRLSPAELHLDFDCAESRLDGYRVWAGLLRREIAPVPLVLTALPSWLRQPAFARLAAASDGYILQVHSLERPKSFHAPFTLCDPAAARRAVEAAGKIPVPFRVALPTYAYHVGFDAKDKFTGLDSHGPLAPGGDRRPGRGVVHEPARGDARDHLVPSSGGRRRFELAAPDFGASEARSGSSSRRESRKPFFCTAAARDLSAQRWCGGFPGQHRHPRAGVAWPHGGGRCAGGFRRGKKQRQHR
jgi:hypothetical protein